MNKPTPFLAALRIWIAMLVLGPVFMFVLSLRSFLGYYEPSRLGFVFDALFAWMGFISVLFIFSLPAAIMFWLALAMLYRFELRKWVFLSTVLAVTFLLVFATVLVIVALYGTWDLTSYGFLSAYWLASVAGVYWAFLRSNTPVRHLPTAPLDSEL